MNDLLYKSSAQSKNATQHHVFVCNIRSTAPYFELLTDIQRFEIKNLIFDSNCWWGIDRYDNLFWLWGENNLKRSAAFTFFLKNIKAAWKKIKRRILLLLSLVTIILHSSYNASRFYDKCHIFMTIIFCYGKWSE